MDNQVVELRRRAGAGEQKSMLAREFGISREHDCSTQLLIAWVAVFIVGALLRSIFQIVRAHLDKTHFQCRVRQIIGQVCSLVGRSNRMHRIPDKNILQLAGQARLDSKRLPTAVYL